MESIFDIKAEAERDEAIEKFKQRMIMSTERDVHIAFEVYGRDTVIDLVADDRLAFHLDDRKINQVQGQFEVAEDHDAAFTCLFGGDDPKKHLREKIEALIDELIADYEVML